MAPLLSLLTLLAAEPTEADRLFAEGRKAMKTRPQEACPLFEKSFELDPALGALLNLALCYENTGHLPTAWLRFNHAIEWARQTHEGDRERVAREHARELAARMPWVALSPAMAIPGLEAEVAGRRVTLSEPTSLPVEPGKVTVRAHAPGHREWKTELDAPEPGGTLRVEVPALELQEPSARAEPAHLSAVEVGLKTVEAAPGRGPGLGIAVGGISLAVAGLVALAWSLDVNARAQSQRVDTSSSAAPAVSRADFESARTLYPVSLVALGVGAAATGLGVWLRVRSGAPVSIGVAPSPGGAAFVAGGAF
jgi:hypothetical protein